MIKNIIRANTYYDSVTLMLLTKKAAGIAGVQDAAIMMATEHNKDILENSGMLTDEGKKASSSDMVICIKCLSGSNADRIVEEINGLFEPVGNNSENGETRIKLKTFSRAVELMPDANLAIISVPGEYAAREAHKALDAGLNVFLFSDNVSLEEEIELKKKASARGLLLMGPDCGTAYINGAALGFANAVKPGAIGLVAASGTGLQEVISLIAKEGYGISHAIGTGGRDLKEKVGGITMLKGIELLAADPNTRVIVLISKPPSPLVEDKIIQAISTVSKPVVVCFLGGNLSCETMNNHIHFAQTLEEAAAMATAVMNNFSIDKSLREEFLEIKEIARIEAEKFTSSQCYVRGLFTGGTLCYEALLIFERIIGGVYSNVPLKSEYKLKSCHKSLEHTFIDLGEDEFTRGRPHPMIDPALRADRILQEARDPAVAVILFDVVLGYGSHADPAGAVLPQIKSAREYAEREGRSLCFITSLCGTKDDPQGYELQMEKLEQGGVIVMKSNAEAARLAAKIVQKISLKGDRGR